MKRKKKQNPIIPVVMLTALVVLLVVLAFAYYFLVGQYDPEIQNAVNDALDNYHATH